MKESQAQPYPIPTGPLEMLMNTATNKLLSSYKCPFKKDGLTEVGHPKENTMEENDSYNNTSAGTSLGTIFISPIFPVVIQFVCMLSFNECFLVRLVWRNVKFKVIIYAVLRFQNKCIKVEIV